MRPDRVVVVAGTGTDVGKTWVTVELTRLLRREGHRVTLRKPAQSFGPDDPPERRDAHLLAGASGEAPEEVCPPHRWYPKAFAPPMAAAALGRPPFGLADLLAELDWMEGGAGGPALGLLETAGGVRSPQADDGDVVDLARLLRPEIVLVVGDGGLGTINAVRLSLEALSELPARLVVVLNRFDPHDELHRRNREWLAERSGMEVWVAPGELAALARALGDVVTAGPGERLEPLKEG